MSLLPLSEILRLHMNQIIEGMKLRMAERLASNYKDLLLDTEEGHRRIPLLVDLIIRATGDDKGPFLEDQEKIGYDRAVRGVKLDDMYQVFRAFREVCYGVIRDQVPDGQCDAGKRMDQVHQLGNVLFEGYVVVAGSYVKSREEQINEKVAILQKLHDFAQQIIVTLEPEAIVNFVEKEMFSFFGVQAYMTIFSYRRIIGAFNRSEDEMDPEVAKLIARSWTETSCFFADEKGEVSVDVNEFRLKRIVSVPVRAHGSPYGVLALFDPHRAFEFTDKELSLLHQFIYLIALALENAFMVEEIDQSRKQLRLLTDKLLTVREQERKHLAADIHDTLAQALTGIGYKIRYCGELAKTMPERVTGELEGLLCTVNQAVDQCRGLISSLRPDLIDTLGLVPALRNLFDTYTGATGVKVQASLPKKVEASAAVSICLYRAAQEALANIHKHSGAKVAYVNLTEQCGGVTLTVSDKGKGFDNSLSEPWKISPNKLGLLYTKERVESVGGRFTITAGRNAGCTMEAQIPLIVEETFYGQY